MAVSLNVLDTITIDKPCTASWEGMVGDDRVRFCTTCGKNIHDLSKMTDTDKSILMNKDAIAIDQDPLGKEGDRLYQSADLDVWTKPLGNGRVAVGLFNRSWGERDVSVDLAEIGFKSGANLRDVWSQKDLGRRSGVVTETVPRHGVALLIVSK